MEMLRAAVGDDPVLVPSDIEVRRAGPSYTVDTLRELKASEPQAELTLLIGVDQWRELGRWKDAPAIAELATVAVMSRSGENPATVNPGFGVACSPVPVTRIDISSSDVRARARQGRSILHLVPDPVRTIIEREALYASPAVQHA